MCRTRPASSCAACGRGAAGPPQSGERGPVWFESAGAWPGFPGCAARAVPETGCETGNRRREARRQGGRRPPAGVRVDSWRPSVEVKAAASAALIFFNVQRVPVPGPPGYPHVVAELQRKADELETRAILIDPLAVNVVIALLDQLVSQLVQRLAAGHDA